MAEGNLVYQFLVAGPDDSSSLRTRHFVRQIPGAITEWPALKSAFDAYVRYKHPGRSWTLAEHQGGRAVPQARLRDRAGQHVLRVRQQSSGRVLPELLHGEPQQAVARPQHGAGPGGPRTGGVGGGPPRGLERAGVVGVVVFLNLETPEGVSRVSRGYRGGICYFSKLAEAQD